MKNDLFPGMIVTHMVHGGIYLLLTIRKTQNRSYVYVVITFNLRNHIINTWHCINFENWEEL